jgi:hypothetical protein
MLERIVLLVLFYLHFAISWKFGSHLLAVFSRFQSQSVRAALLEKTLR